MAAGDIIIPDGRITPEILEKITSEVVNNIQTTSKDPGQYEEVNSLAGITSIPVFQQSGSTYKLVRVLLSILKGVDGKEVHLQSTETHLQWRWTDGMWENLVAWADLKGDSGDTPVFRTGSSGIEWKYVSEDEKGWKVLVTFEVLKLKFSDLTTEQIAAFWQTIPADVLALFQKPATDVASEVREQMVQISQEASAAIKAASDAAGNAQDAADNVRDGKTPVLESVNAQSGETPSGSFSENGLDANGNPKYILNLTVPAGKDGQPAIFEQGTTTTLEPTEEARVEVVYNGETEQGNPKYILNFFIPRGQIGKPGEGSGNVSADGAGLVIGKKYLFVPDSDDSTSGSFVEYVAPEIPEQVQPDWNATEGKGAILNKPGDATAESAGLMTSEQFQKLEKLNPSYLSNDATGKKVEYTDAGKLLFEGKETFAVDAGGELTLAGKKLSELGRGQKGLDITGLFLAASSDPTQQFPVSQDIFDAVVNAYENYVQFAYVEIEGDQKQSFLLSISYNTANEEFFYDVSLFLPIAMGGMIGYCDYSVMTFTIYEDRKICKLNSTNIRFEADGDGTKFLSNDGTYKKAGGGYSLLAATPTYLGGIKIGYTASGKNYPVQLDGSDKAYVNVPWTDTNTTYDLATQSANGLMSSADKTKMDQLRSYTTSTDISGLNPQTDCVYVNLNSNQSLSAAVFGNTYNGYSITAFVYTAAVRTITIPTTGNYVSMCGSSYTTKAGKWVEFNLTCIDGKWHIAKLEQE